MSIPPTCVVSAAELRQKFNDHDFAGRVQRGELTAHVLSERIPQPMPPHLQPGTRSQIIAYRDANGVQVAVVHQYLQPDNTLGASGRPDPKRIILNNLLYIVV
jgi:hypothetical protein